MLRKLVIAAVLLALLAGVATIAWQACGMPPLRLVLKYGLPPVGGPTGKRLTVEGVEFVELRPGYFQMGSWFPGERPTLIGRLSRALGISPAHDNFVAPNAPPHWVEISSPFWLSVTEVTGLQVRAVWPTTLLDPGDPSSPQPATGLTWEEACHYASLLGSRSGYPVHLPSEAQWEHARRAGCRQETAEQIDTYSIYLANCARHYSGDTTLGPIDPMGMEENSWGIRGLAGNVSEWCADRWHPDYRGAPINEIQWVDGVRKHRVIRGGSWTGDELNHLSFRRSAAHEETMAPWLGLRLAIGPLDRH